MSGISAFAPAEPRARQWGALSPEMVLGLFVVACFALGGSSFSDVKSLVWLRAISVIVFAYGLYGVRREQVLANRFMFGVLGAVVLLPLLQLIPLPPGVWQRLPSRDLIASADAAIGIEAAWRPLTMAPLETASAFFATLVPAAVLLLASRLDSRGHRRMLALVLAMTALSAIVALLQGIGGAQSPLYFYSFAGSHIYVGLFANRNHQALLLATAIPMLAAFAAGLPRSNRVGRFLAFLAAFSLLPMILITGSRMGLVAGGLAIAASPWVLMARNSGNAGGSTRQKQRPVPARAALWASGLAAVLAMIAITAWFSRDVAIDRLVQRDVTDDLRFAMQPTLYAMIAKYWLFGSGFGSFEHVWQLHEPIDLVLPNYINQAHNDWLETAFTGGLPAILLLALAVLAFLLRTVQALFPREAEAGRLRMARLGLAMVAIFAVGSVSDYFLRVPSLAVVFTFAALWASRSLKPS